MTDMAAAVADLTETADFQNLPSSGYWVSVPKVMWLERDADHKLLSDTKVKNK
jgi:hypothetical protein